MFKSMTAFGRGRGMSSDGDKDITAEVKSVNNRYLDCNIKLPKAYSFLEDKIKAYLTERGIVRGKIDVYIGIDIIEQTGLEVALDSAITKSYIDALYRLRDEFSLCDDISVMTVAANRDLFTIKRLDDDMEKDWVDIRLVLAQAVDSFIARRESEGANLEADIRSKVENIKNVTSKIGELSKYDTDNYREKLEARIKQILGEDTIEINEQRILTEVAIFADRVSVDEELVRLSSHFSAMDEIIKNPEPAGRKLDFLMQEMNRETNTIGSKANNSEIAHLVVSVKTELEKIREQIQNIE